jgi:hypothetical protein
LSTLWTDPQVNDPGLVFGPIVGAHEVELAVLETLRKWERTYTWHVLRGTGYDPEAFPRIKAWRATSETENYYQDHHPAVVVRSLAGEVVRKGGGAAGKMQTWRWEMEVVTQSVTKSSRSPKDPAIPQPRYVAMIYATAFRGILVQKRDDGGVLGMIDVQGERYMSTPANAERSVHLASVLCTVEVPKVVEWGRGPAEPLFPPDTVPPDDDPRWPPAQEIQTPIQKTPLEGSLDEDDPDNQLPEPKR